MARHRKKMSKKTRSRPFRRAGNSPRGPSYCFNWAGQTYRLPAEKYWELVRAGFLIQRNDNYHIACVSDKYRPIFDPANKVWIFVWRKPNPVSTRSTLALLLQQLIYRTPINEWREVISALDEPKSDHPVVFILR